MRTGRTQGVLDITTGTVVQMMGWDDDCDQDLLDAVTGAAGSPPVDDSYEDVVDTVLMWWRDDDGDLIDGLLDAMALLAQGGAIWLLTPKPGRDGHVEPQEIADAGPTAGLRSTANISAGKDWNGTRLVPR
jgi:Protein of unknown function (DUF3052)